MKTELTLQEKRATIDAINRFKDADPELQKRYDVEYVIGDFTPKTLSDLKQFLEASGIKYKELKRRQLDVFVVIEMKLEIDKVIEIETYLTYFVNNYGFKYDGWGALE